MKEKSKKDNRSLTSLIDELETSINATGDSLNKELIKAIKQRNNEIKKNTILIIYYCNHMFNY